MTKKPIKVLRDDVVKAAMRLHGFNKRGMSSRQEWDKFEDADERFCKACAALEKRMKKK